MKKFLRTLGGIAILLVIWQALAILFDKNIIIPKPADTLLILGRSLLSSELWLAIWQTIWKVILALFLTIIIGLPAGLFLGLSDPLYNLCRPIVMMIQAVPVISWLSLVIFMWGIGWKGPIFISFLSLLPTALLTTVSGVRDLDRNLLEMAKLYRVPRKRVIKVIHLGSLLPFIAAILDVSIGQAWKVILVAEYLCGGKGLGEEILMARMNVDIPSVWALSLIAVLLGICTEFLIKSSMRRFHHPWKSA